MDLAGITFADLYLRYLALGGDGTQQEVRRHLADDAYGARRQHNTIAQALNEVFLEGGHNHPVAYRALDAGGAGAAPR